MQSWGLDLESVTWVNTLVGFAAGENLLIKTSDGGLTWQEIDIPKISRLNKIKFWDENLGFAVGVDGIVLKTSNGGGQWSQINSPTDSDLFSISFIDEKSLIIVGESGGIYKSLDLGTSWKSIASSVNSSLNEILFLNTEQGFIVGNNGALLTTIDGGNSFSKKNLPITNNLNSIAFSSDLIGYIVGESGIVLKTEDAGINWTTLNSGVTVELNQIDISLIDPRILVIIGDQATSIKSTNSGVSFSKANLGAGNTRNLKSLQFIPGTNQVTAVGQDGYLINSANAGTSWATKLAGYRNNFSSIDFKSDRVGFVSGQNGSFYFTSNGALSLVDRSLPEIKDIENIDFWNTSFGYAASKTGQMFRTGNSGRTWISVPAETTYDITGFYLFAPSVLYITGTNGYIARSFDSGVTWDSNIATNTSENLKDVTYFDFQVGFAIGEKGQISWTNGGNIWENLPKLTDKNLNSLSKLDSSTAIIVGDGGVILKSVDQAKTWRLINSDITENLNSVDFWDENIGIIAGDNGLTLQSKDGGETWLQIKSGTKRNLNSISMGNSLVAFAAGDDGTLLNYTCITPPGISEISGETNVCLGISSYYVEDTNITGSQIVWRVDGGEIISGQSTNSIVVNWTEIGRQGVFVSRQNFCGNGETSALEVEVLTKPNNEKEIQGLGSVCTNLNETYSLPLEAGVVYNWQAEGGEIISGQTSSEVLIQWNEVGEKILTVVLENSCGESTPIIKKINVSAPPDQPSAIFGENQLGIGESFYQVENIEGINYYWEISGNGGSILSGQGTNIVLIEWLNEGDFLLKVTPQNNCNNGPSSELEINVNIITWVEPNTEKDLKIFPNPSRGTLTISSENLSFYNEIVILNAFGQEVFKRNILEGQSEIFMTELPKGLLLLRLRNQSNSVTKKIIIN
ncbi:YCF48-related protein [Algoriphagus sp.]|uniref:YCF48-related protein n=1 Tax=Algoriphagus sp. TaxID=1872435 RepID=UPI0025E7BCB1|nr:YCF48-related protein [Algoriphagus sp.]